ncbi:YfhO family protein, partial [Globicatella sulfidifaciens]
MLVVWAFMGVYPFGDETLMSVDFGQQYIDFFRLYKRTLWTGDLSNLFYSFSKSIGGTMISNWAYYLMSPFYLIYAL